MHHMDRWRRRLAGVFEDLLELPRDPNGPGRNVTFGGMRPA